VLLGPRESEAGVVAIRDLVAGSQEDVPLDGAASWLEARL
jgi:hypothetical protein